MKSISLKLIVNCILIFLFSFGLQAQNDDRWEKIYSDTIESEPEDEYEYYYDWDMPLYAVGLNMNSLLAFFPAYTITHDIGISENKRVAIETSYIPNYIGKRGFKLRTTYQHFFFKDENFGLFTGVGYNLVSYWEPRIDEIVLENTYTRRFKEVRNQTFFSAVGELGAVLHFEGLFIEFTGGLGGGVQRAGGTYRLIDDFQWGIDLIPTDPGVYFFLPSYLNMSFYIPVYSMYN